MLTLVSEMQFAGAPQDNRCEAHRWRAIGEIMLCSPTRARRGPLQDEMKKVQQRLTMRCGWYALHAT